MVFLKRENKNKMTALVQTYTMFGYVRNVLFYENEDVY
jgi:hypothetical protein